MQKMKWIRHVLQNDPRCPDGAAGRLDAMLIEQTCECIRQDINSQTRLADKVARRSSVKQYVALRVLKQYAGADPDVYFWNFTVGARGIRIYYLI